MLSQLDKNTTYDFLGGKTPAQVSADLKQLKKDSFPVFSKYQGVESQMTDAEMSSYVQRMKIYGERAAMKWAVELHPPADTQP